MEYLLSVKFMLMLYKLCFSILISLHLLFPDGTKICVIDICHTIRKRIPYKIHAHPASRQRKKYTSFSWIGMLGKATNTRLLPQWSRELLSGAKGVTGSRKELLWHIETLFTHEILIHRWIWISMQFFSYGRMGLLYQRYDINSLLQDEWFFRWGNCLI